MLYIEKTLNPVQGDVEEGQSAVLLKDALTFRYDERHPTVMLNLFQHLIELWLGALSSRDPESSLG